ncbi:MAG: hypothetical protein OXU23_25585 [Candidatus Poribacteria bacterium]|nr:hypothetical protein [Candidatus Poribacteria bacterium]
MRLTVHNVGHGSCISLIHENGNVMLWDCGHTYGNRPSDFLPSLGRRTINRLFITNFDEDHISDLPALRQNLNIEILHSNRSISKEQLKALKLQSGPISSAMNSMLDMLNIYTGGAPEIPPAFPSVSFYTYCNKYLTDFDDTNNISLVTFVNCNGRNFVIPGDIEQPGWENLLEQRSFCESLKTVHIFVASHHGRENGYCPEVFEYCSPELIIFSDSSIKHATQEMASKYASHASGARVNGETRDVLSTRNDGEIWWDR